MVTALISISGHGPAVITVYVPQALPRARKNASRRRGGNARRLVTHGSLPFPVSALILPSVTGTALTGKRVCAP